LLDSKQALAKLAEFITAQGGDGKVIHNFNLLPKGQNKNLQKKVIAEPFINAPVQQGQKYGELIVLKDGKEIGKTELIAEKTIARAGFSKIFQTMLSNLLSF